MSKSTPRRSPDWLQGFRASLAHGDRDASIWGAVATGIPKARVAENAGITGARVGQIVKAVKATLAAWPETPEWLQGLPERQRELCLLHRLFDPDALAEVAFRIAFEDLPRQWKPTDAAVVREYLLKSDHAARMRGWAIKAQMRALAVGLAGMQAQLKQAREALDGYMDLGGSLDG